MLIIIIEQVVMKCQLHGDIFHRDFHEPQCRTFARNVWVKPLIYYTVGYMIAVAAIGAAEPTEGKQ